MQQNLALCSTNTRNFFDDCRGVVVSYHSSLLLFWTILALDPVLTFAVILNTMHMQYASYRIQVMHGSCVESNACAGFNKML